MIVPRRESSMARRHLGNYLYDSSQFPYTSLIALCFAIHAFLQVVVQVQTFLFLQSTLVLKLLDLFLSMARFAMQSSSSLAWNDLEKSCISHIDANLLVFLSPTFQPFLKSVLYNTNHIHWDSTQLIVIGLTCLFFIQHFPFWQPRGLQIYIHLLS